MPQRFDIIVPPLPTTAGAQLALQIDPDQLAREAIALSEALLSPNAPLPPDTIRKHARTTERHRKHQDLGFISSLERQGWPEVYVRTLYPLNNIPSDSIFATYPTGDAEVASEHMLWHGEEQGRYQSAGGIVPPNYPILLRDRERWGSHWAIVQAVQRVPRSAGESIGEIVLRSGLAAAQAPIRTLGNILLSYYTDPSRADNTVIGDWAATKQHRGITVLDLDPYRCNRVSELLSLAKLVDAHTEDFGTGVVHQETKTLHDAIVNNYRSAQALTAYQARAKYEQGRVARANTKIRFA